MRGGSSLRLKLKAARSLGGTVELYNWSTCRPRKPKHRNVAWQKSGLQCDPNWEISPAWHHEIHSQVRVYFCRFYFRLGVFKEELLGCIIPGFMLLKEA